MCFTALQRHTVVRFYEFWSHTQSHTQSHTTPHTDDVKKEKRLWPASPVPFEQFICCSLTCWLVMLQKRTSTIWKRPQTSSSARGVQQFPLVSVLPRAGRRAKRNLHSDLPHVCGQAESLKCFWLVKSFPPALKSKPAIGASLYFQSWSPHHVSCVAFKVCVCGNIRVLIVSAGHTLGTLASHLVSHCAGLKMYAGSEVRVLSVSCTGYMVLRSRSLKGSC